MTKVVYNACHGGFGLSDKLVALYEELTGDQYREDHARHNPVLVQLVEQMGEEASGRYADLRIKDIGDAPYFIDEYDGYEEVITPADLEERWIKV